MTIVVERQNPSGVFETRYTAFLETITQLRPSLHRYCSRMTGSVLDGEDVVQDALFQAYRNLESFDESRSLSTWLFRIAHNRCLDFLRHRSVVSAAEAEMATSDLVLPIEPPGLGLGNAIEYLVLSLPAKERAAVLLKDVFDYSLQDVAKVINSTVGGVKAALKRARTKLAGQSLRPHIKGRTVNERKSQLIELYVARFNRRDWDGLRELISADARLGVADRFLGRLDEGPYFGNYERSLIPWRLTVGAIDGEEVVVVMHHGSEGWTPGAVVRLESKDNIIEGIRDYAHCPWIVPAASSLVLGSPPEPNGQ